MTARRRLCGFGFISHYCKQSIIPGSFISHCRAAVGLIFRAIWWFRLHRGLVVEVGSASAYKSSRECRTRELWSPMEFCLCGIGSSWNSLIIRNCFAMDLLFFDLFYSMSSSTPPPPHDLTPAQLVFPWLRVHNNVRLFLRVRGVEFPIYYPRVVVMPGFL